jgi:hypothetical protein
MHNMRRVLKQSLAFQQRVPHHADLPLTQIANSAMNQFGRTAGGSLSKIVGFNKDRPMPSRSRFNRRTESSGSSANDNNIPWSAAVIQSGNHVSTVHVINPSIPAACCVFG